MEAGPENGLVPLGRGLGRGGATGPLGGAAVQRGLLTA